LRAQLPDSLVPALARPLGLSRLPPVIGTVLVMARVPGASLEVGPANDEGDPAWIRPALKEGGARPNDEFHSYGRLRARLYPPTTHPMRTNPMPMIRHGYRLAIERWNATVADLPEDLAAEEGLALDAQTSPSALVVIATHDVLEWVHSMHDFLRASGVYSDRLTPSEVDSELGPYVDGLLAARIALHHQFTPVVGLVPVESVRYRPEGDRWVLQGLSDSPPRLQVRWSETIPEINSTRQRQAFLEYLAGRHAGDTFEMATHYFWTQMGSPPEVPFVESGPADHPPPIDPNPPALGSATPEP